MVNPTKEKCQHFRNYGHALVDGHLVCGKCHEAIPWPMAADRCGHHGGRFPFDDHDVCAECGTSLPKVA